MKTTILLSIILIANIKIALGCCAEKIYRLLPLGELNGNVVLIEFDLNRNCNFLRDPHGNNEFWISGKVNIVKAQSDTLIHINQIDTINTNECDCNYSNQYELSENESVLEQKYLKALELMKNKPGFKLARTVDIIFNDTINTRRREILTDTTNSVLIDYNDLFSIEVKIEEIISCFPDKVSEVRYYETDNHNITILRLRCKLLEKTAIEYNQERFKSIETAIWKESAQWHGMAKDYLIIKKNNR